MPLGVVAMEGERGEVVRRWCGAGHAHLTGARVRIASTRRSGLLRALGPFVNPDRCRDQYGLLHNAP